MVNKVIRYTSLVRDGSQPPTFPSLRAAQGHHGHFVSTRRRQPAVRRFAPVLLAAALPVLIWAAAGCKTPVDVQGDYSTATETITGGVDAASNSITVGGNYRAGTTNVGASVTVGK